jgi:hypothetical protein
VFIYIYIYIYIYRERERERERERKKQPIFRQYNEVQNRCTKQLTKLFV